MKKYRSLLFVPAEDKYLAKIGKANADAYIIDLEDSISDVNKKAALQRTCIFLESYDKNNLFVRINKDRYLEELKDLSMFRVGIVLPKIQSYDDYYNAEYLLNDRQVIALLETPRAMVNLNSIAAIKWIDALAFGAEDYTVATGMLNTYDNLTVIKNLLVLSARAYGKLIFDTPCFQLKDEQVLEAELRQAINLGFDGKLAIHPEQVEPINSVFDNKDIERNKEIVAIFEKSGKAVCEIDGKVYEQLHINKIKEKYVNVLDD